MTTFEQDGSTHLASSAILFRAFESQLTTKISLGLLQTMSLISASLRYLRPTKFHLRPFSTSRYFGSKERQHQNIDEHRQFQKDKPLTPHMTNTNSTIANDVPSVGSDKAPPDLVSAVDPKYVPQDKVPENTDRMTGSTQHAQAGQASGAELGVGELEGAELKVEPQRRAGEDDRTMRARLLCPSRIGRCRSWLIRC